MSATYINSVENNLLQELKRQFDPVRRNLCEIRSHRDKLPASSRFRWEFNSGNGCYDLMPVTPEEIDAIESLLKDGIIVPTFERDLNGVLTYRLLEHFDDVDFGVVGENIVIYGHPPGNEREYQVIQTDKEHDAAIAILKARLQSDEAIIHSKPIQLKNGPLVRPIQTNPHMIALTRHLC